MRGTHWLWLSSLRQSPMQIDVRKRAMIEQMFYDQSCLCYTNPIISNDVAIGGIHFL